MKKNRKKIVEEALKEAKILELKAIPSREEVLRQYEEQINLSEKLRNMLSSEWWVSSPKRKLSNRPSRKT